MPYKLEKVDLIDDEIADLKLETLDMLENDINEDPTPLYILINDSLNIRDLSVNGLANTIGNLILRIVAKDISSEDLVKEVTVTANGADILVLVPLSEAKETNEQVLEDEFNKALASIIRKKAVKADTDIIVDDDNVTIIAKITL